MDSITPNSQRVGGFLFPRWPPSSGGDCAMLEVSPKRGGSNELCIIDFDAGLSYNSWLGWNNYRYKTI